MDKEQLKEILYQRFINDDGEGWTEEQMGKIEDCLQEIGEQYLKMYFNAMGLDAPELDPEKNIMNDQWLLDNKYIMRSVEMLVGAATEEIIKID